MSRRYPPGSIPPATAAASDLVCWLHAAYRPRPDGWLPTTRVAADLGVSARTIRRWAQESERTPTPPQRTYLARRAILRGRGTYLWPDLDDAGRFRQRTQGQLHAGYAAQVDAGDTRPYWRDRGHLETFWVVLAWYPRAHVYQVAIGRTDKALSRIAYRAEILKVQHAPSMFHANAVKAATLAAHADRQCITPRALVPTGRTDTLRQTGGTPTLTHPLRPQQDAPSRP